MAEANNLSRLVTREEIYAAVHDLLKNKAPGPNDFAATFSQAYWNIVNRVVVNAVMKFFHA